MRVLILLLLACCCPAAFGQPAPWLARQSPDLVQALAQRHAVDADGAMGRNRKAYFHARFQMGVHQLAAAAVHKRDAAMAARTLDAIEYAFDRQAPDGGFEAVIPAALRGQRAPSDVDLASGSAFFLSSAATALVMLDPPGAPSGWLPASTRQRIAALRPALARALDYLQRHRQALHRADARAPNRLLFSALAFEGLGQLLDDAGARDAAAAFTRQALARQHADGYFIEGGGFDSSYNGVACAVGLRLLSLAPDQRALADALEKALAWQRRRVAADGEILTEGNQRVRPGGESFLGAEKGVDAAHSVEALMLSAAWRDDATDLARARSIAAHYRHRR